MRRQRLVIFFVLLLIILVAMLFALSGVQYSALRLSWAIFQLKYLVYTLIGLVGGLIIGYFAGVYYERLRK